MTQRQLRILTLAAQGLTMDGIGARVYLTDWSVKNELVRVRGELRARNTAHAIAIAVGAGLIQPDRPPRRLRRPSTTGTGWPT